MQITQYGLRPTKGGWDLPGDSGTDMFQGNGNNTILCGVDCALTESARAALGAKDDDWLQVVFSNGYTYYRRYRDTAPESNMRVDFFNAYAFDHQMDGAGQEADVTLLGPLKVVSKVPWWNPFNK